MTTPPHDEARDDSAEDIRREEEAIARTGDLFYGNVGEFVTDRLIYLWGPPAPESGRMWCPEWYRHAEALSRLDSVWRAWEALRWDGPLGMSNWWLHHADPHMRALTDPLTGPFTRCGDGHRAPEPLPVLDPPEGLFTDSRTPLPRDPFALD
jgi:hypothetical protein